MKFYKRLVVSIYLMIVGLGLIWFGFFGLVDLKPQEAFSDSEVRKRASEMGWVPIKEVLQEPTTTSTD